MGLRILGSVRAARSSWDAGAAGTVKAMSETQRADPSEGVLDLIDHWKPYNDGCMTFCMSACIGVCVCIYFACVR